MRKRFLLLIGTIFMLCLPAIATRHDQTPFVSVALAGHTIAGEYCQDGSPDCLPGDPGELRSANRNRKAAGPLGSPGAGSNRVAMLVAFELLRWIVVQF